MAFACALSEHPVTVHAVSETIGHVLDRVGAEPNLAAVFVSRHHAGALEDVAGAIVALLAPDVLIGCAAESLVANDREVEGQPAVVLWAGTAGPVAPLRLDMVRTGTDTAVVTGWPPDPPFRPQAAILIADPYSFAVEGFLDQLHNSGASLPLVGGLASGGHGPGGNRLVLGGDVHTSGAVGVLLSDAVDVETVVSQGCRPIGRPLTVTDASDNLIRTLAGTAPLERVQELAADHLSGEEVDLIRRGGLHIGRVIDEHRAEFRTGDFLVRNIIGGNRQDGSMAVNDLISVGDTVQFHLRDAAAADEDLRLAVRERTAEAALLFTCNGRGMRLFGEPDHDASVVADALDGPPVAGFFAAGELGPVGGRNFVHGFTASLLLFRGR